MFFYNKFSGADLAQNMIIEKIFVVNFVTQIFIKEFDRITFHTNLRNNFIFHFKDKSIQLFCYHFSEHFSRK